ncbi:uncharacterized protein METZ01_LOCUS51861, partial [marine metagenome]
MAALAAAEIVAPAVGNCNRTCAYGPFMVFFCPSILHWRFCYMPPKWLLETTQMERPIFQPVGTSVEELDTPALVIDLDVMDKNIQTFQGYFAATVAKARPVVTSHLCPQIARRQLDAGGTVGGIAVTTVGEAEVFASAGFSDILLANQVVTVSKIRRLCALAGQTSIGIAVDNPDNAQQLSSGAVES